MRDLQQSKIDRMNMVEGVFALSFFSSKDRMNFFSFLLFSLFSFSCSSTSIVLENDLISLVFHEEYGYLQQITDKNKQIDLLSFQTQQSFSSFPSSTSTASSSTTSSAATSSSSSIPLWKINFVDEYGEITLTNIGMKITSEKKVMKDYNELNLKWNDLTVNRNHFKTTVDVILSFSLPIDSSIASISLYVNLLDGEPLGIWDVKISIPFTVGNDSNGELFFPSGFGTTYLDPSKYEPTLLKSHPLIAQMK